ANIDGKLTSSEPDFESNILPIQQIIQTERVLLTSADKLSMSNIIIHDTSIYDDTCIAPLENQSNCNNIGIDHNLSLLGIHFKPHDEICLGVAIAGGGTFELLLYKHINNLILRHLAPSPSDLEAYRMMCTALFDIPARL